MKITLLHYLFESDNQNLLLFNNAEQRDEYFAGISDKITIQNINFFANDIMQTKVYVRVDNLSLFHLLNYNYAIIENSTGETQQKPLFFYIENSRQDSGGQIELSLKCDIGNTYFYDVDMTKWQAIVERTHLDRITQPDIHEDNYVFAFGENSQLYERERVKNCSKRVVQREKLYFQIDKTTNSKFNEWIKNNIVGWKYYYLADNVNYKHLYYLQYTEYNTDIIDIDGNNDTDFVGLSYITEQNERALGIENFLPTSTYSNFKVIACPVYKQADTFNDTHIIKIRQEYGNSISGYQTMDMEFDESGIWQFLKQNNMFANVLSIKFSTMPPFNPELLLTENTDYSIDINGNLIINYGNNTFKINGYNTTEFMYASAYNNPTITQLLPLIHIQNQYLFENYKVKCDLDLTQLKWNFTKNFIKAYSNYIAPKLYNEDYATYRLIIGGQTYDMPISKTSNEPHFIYSEILSPDITKAQLSYDVENSGLVSEIPQVFKEHSMRDFTGLTFTIDLSMWYPSNELQNYLASNKNYLQIFNNQQMQRFITGAINSTGAMIGGIATGNYTGISQGSGIITNSVKNQIELHYNRENLDLTIDNMANAPDKISSINSNAMLISAVQKEIAIFIEVLEMLPFEQQTMIDYFKQFGYTYNRLSTIDENLRTRKYYNYIQAQIFEIPDNLGNNVKAKIKEMFANGIRFWHYDNFDGVDFTKNNYERFLDE